MIIRLIVSTIAVLITAYVLDGVIVDHWWWAAIVAIVLGLINTFIKPIVKFFTLPINLLTLGLFSLVINALMVELAAWILKPHFVVQDFWWAMGFSIALTIIGWLLHLFVPDKKKKKRKK